MKYRLFLSIGIVLLSTAGFAQKKGKKSKKKDAPKEVVMENLLDTFSYSLGVNIGNNLKMQGLDEINYELLVAGFKDMLQGESQKITAAQTNDIINGYIQSAMARKNEKIKKEGVDYLAANGKKEGVTTLASGMQYMIMKEGTGPKPTAADQVKTHYHGMLINGKVFDSSVERGQPATFGVGQVIQGWQEALQLMPVGSKWKLFIPSNLAYGDRGAPPNIPPFATLVFEVELLEIVK